MTKVMTIVGTRPEIIRLSETIKLLDRMSEHVLVHRVRTTTTLSTRSFSRTSGCGLPTGTSTSTPAPSARSSEVSS